MTSTGRLLGTLVLVGCARAVPGVQSDAAPPASSSNGIPARSPEGARTQHVVVISIDGLRPDAIDSAPAPTLQRLRREGAVAVRARTIVPSITLPSHASMVSGVEPRVHGITWNDWRVDQRGTITVSTMFSIARRAGLATALVGSKPKLAHLGNAAALDFLVLPPPGDDMWRWEHVVNSAVLVMREDPAIELMLVHLGEVDAAGHGSGWMSADYRAAVAAVDSGVAEIVAEADAVFGAGKWVLILTADHGGRWRLHGSSAPEDAEIPWIAWGEGIRRGEIPRPVRTTDTAPTALYLLGLEAPRSWTGRAVREAFTPAAAPAP